MICVPITPVPPQPAGGRGPAKRELGTLLFDLLTAEEEREDARTGHLRFDIDLLAEGLVTAVAQMSTEFPDLPIGLFAASTGAVGGPGRGGRAAGGSSGSRVPWRPARPGRGHAPRGAGADAVDRRRADEQVIEMNLEAMRRLRCEAELQIIPGATHLFEEPGALEEVARLATDRLHRHRTRGSKT